MTVERVSCDHYGYTKYTAVVNLVLEYLRILKETWRAWVMHGSMHGHVSKLNAQFRKEGQDVGPQNHHALRSSVL